VPLHHTDYGYGIHRVKLAFQQTLCTWIPYYKEFPISSDLNTPEDTTGAGAPNDSFAFHCAMAPMVWFNMNPRGDATDVALARRMAAIWRRAAALVLQGDFYPLTPFSTSGERWVARQFDNPETGTGFIQGIRLAACDAESLTSTPRALRPDAVYLLDNPETGERREVAGATLLREGLTFALPRRSGAIWFYSEQAAR
jgi:hypothetical protein